MRKAFNFYRSYYEVAKELKETDRAKFLWAILQRQFEGIEPKIEGVCKLAYISQQHSIESQVIGYEHKTGEKLTPIGGGSVGGGKGGSVQGEGEEKEEVQYVGKTKFHSFEKSKYFDKVEFANSFPDWSKEKLKYYYENACDYSTSKGVTYRDWKAAIRNWERKDSANGKNQLLNSKLKENTRGLI